MGRGQSCQAVTTTKATACISSRTLLTLLRVRSWRPSRGDRVLDAGRSRKRMVARVVSVLDLSNVGDNFFNPSSRTVSSGTTVTWNWVSEGNSYTGAGPNSHSVTFDDGVGSSVTQSEGKHTRQFAAAGTFPYHCTIHGSAVMSGVIVVQ